MRAVVLAGGKGSRLRPLTITIPKPLVPVGDLPIIEILVRQLAAQGFDGVTISVGYLAPLIQAYCGDGSQWGIPIDYVVEDRPLGTVGALSLVAERHDDDLFLLANGDTLTDLDMAGVFRLHDPTDAITVCASRRVVNIDFGVLEQDEAGYLSAYSEKPSLGYEVSMGINVVSRWALERWVAPGERLDLPEFVLRVMEAGERVKVHAPDVYWQDLGRLEDLEAGTRDFLDRPERFLPE